MSSAHTIKIDYYYDYAELEQELKLCAQTAPELCRLQVIGTTHEGRNLSMLVVTDYSVGVPEEKPGFYVEACTHAEEFCGTNVTLQLLNTLLHPDGEDQYIANLLKDVVFYILPRVNPDGVDVVMKTGLIGVSNGKYPVDARQPLPGLYMEDLDHNGIIAQMRIEDPDGEWKVSEKDPRIMVLRKPYEMGGKYYRLYPEGMIRGETTGFLIPKTRDVNLNRNYPCNWQPEGLQYGACELPLSEPETKAVADFFVSHPNIAGVMTYHTNAGAVTRPFSNKGDECFKGQDLAIYNALGGIGTEELGYEVISTYGGFTPDKTRIRGGTLADWLFECLGIPTITLELWNVYDAAGTKRPEGFHFAARSEETELAVLKWSDSELGSKGYLEWKEFDHPQLGKVEIGGWNWIWEERNPPVHYLPELSAKGANFAIKMARALPKLVVTSTKVEHLAENVYKLSAVIHNSGYLPTYITSQAKYVNCAPPIHAELKPVAGSFQIVCTTDREDIGHLEGRFGRIGEWSRDRENWKPTEHKVEWVITVESEKLELELVAGTARSGSTHCTITVR